MLLIGNVDGDVLGFTLLLRERLQLRQPLPIVVIRKDRCRLIRQRRRFVEHATVTVGGAAGVVVVGIAVVGVVVDSGGGVVTLRAERLDEVCCRASSDPGASTGKFLGVIRRVNFLTACRRTLRFMEISTGTPSTRIMVKLMVMLVLLMATTQLLVLFLSASQ